MEKVKVIGLTSFSSIGVSFYPGMQADVEKKQADEWIKAGLVKKANEDIEVAQIIEEPKELTAEEIERNNLESMAKQLGVEMQEELTNDEIEDLIQGAISAKKEAKLAQAQGQEAPQDENPEEEKKEDLPTGEGNSIPKKPRK